MERISSWSPEGGPACSAKRREARQQTTFADWCEECEGQAKIHLRLPPDYAQGQSARRFRMLWPSRPRDRHLNSEKEEAVPRLAPGFSSTLSRPIVPPVAG